MSQIKFDYTVNFKRPVNSNDLIYYKEESEIENGKNKTISNVFLEMSGILKSDVNNEQAIRKAAEIAIERNCQLYVKVHPAETDVEMLKRYQVLRDELNFKLVDANTTELIKKANKIVTINSTVGLEALIYNKPLTVLGRAIYTNFNYELMKKYIHSYLVNCDYFSEQPISSSEFNKITNLFEVSNLVEKG